MTGKLLAYYLKSPRVPLVVRVPQFENHCSIGSSRQGINLFKYPCFDITHKKLKSKPSQFF